MLQRSTVTSHLSSLQLAICHGTHCVYAMRLARQASPLGFCTLSSALGLQLCARPVKLFQLLLPLPPSPSLPLFVFPLAHLIKTFVCQINDKFLPFALFIRLQNLQHTHESSARASLPVPLHPSPPSSSGNTIWSSAKCQFASEPRKVFGNSCKPDPVEPEIDTTIDTIDTLNTKREERVGAAAANGHGPWPGWLRELLAIRQHYQTINGPIEAS